MTCNLGLFPNDSMARCGACPRFEIGADSGRFLACFRKPCYSLIGTIRCWVGVVQAELASWEDMIVERLEQAKA
jgi:hypothetical protein